MQRSFHHLALQEDCSTTHTVAACRLEDGSFGLDVDRDGVIRGVHRAQAADLHVGDRITAINGLRGDKVSLQDLSAREAARFISVARAWLPPPRLDHSQPPHSDQRRPPRLHSPREARVSEDNCNSVWGPAAH